jgi:hypothetical protein
LHAFIGRFARLEHRCAEKRHGAAEQERKRQASDRSNPVPVSRASVSSRPL